ncbi:MAG TPA: hypothetical protein PLV68_07035, partial [Ilumatobacteraceae bacterium]|nr:hypothetical protein [Ilumatobacteraceae bacterium]
GQSFRRVATLDIGRHDPVPHDFTGRVRHSADGVVVAVGWYQNGHLHNPGRLHPAYRQFRVGGQVKYDHFYRHGVLHDPNESTPAVRGY